jgi:N12 class adenine-specific DNA methylase
VRAAQLAGIYNDKLNGIVLRNYDDAELSLPGLALGFEPRPHQVAAVARMICEPAVGLFHEVGAGKTAEMTMGVMELRRPGLVRKPAIIGRNPPAATGSCCRRQRPARSAALPSGWVSTTARSSPRSRTRSPPRRLF